MKKLLIGLFGLMTQATFAQQDQLEVSEGANAGDWNLDWNGVGGRFYTLQFSLDLVTWEYFPAIEYGTGAHMFGFSSSAPKTFIRLHYMDVSTSNPLGGDIDGDGLTNQQEVYTYGTNPFHSDTDGDGLVDELEDYAGIRFDSTLPDTNENGISDANEDLDLDGVIMIMEFGVYGTDGTQPDSDGDSLPDGWEIEYGFDPNKEEGGDKAPSADPDGDGLDNLRESDIGTDPYNEDADGDGIDDKTERDQGSSPLDDDDKLPPPEGTTPVNFIFGDPSSGSMSEKYLLKLTPLEGDDTGLPHRKRTNYEFGSPRTVRFQLPKGSKYKVELIHDETNRKKTVGGKLVPDAPEFDYQIELLSRDGCLVLEDPENFTGIGGTPGFNDQTFGAAGKSATLYVPKFEWITPRGDPVTAPDDTIPGKNEFSFDKIATGELQMKSEALVKPTGTTTSIDTILGVFHERCKFYPDTIVGSDLIWITSANKANPDGDKLYAEFKYSKLLALNDSSGLKFMRLFCDNERPFSDGKYEVFFDKDSKNHPGVGAGTTLNWFFYWQQVGIPTGRIATMVYGGASNINLALTNPVTREATFFDGSSELNPIGGGTGTGNEGIHTFNEMIAHENNHIVLWERWWGVGSNSDPALDLDRDRYPDSFENTQEAIGFGFSIGSSNANDNNYENDDYDSPLPTANAAGTPYDGRSAGYYYEEKKCDDFEKSVVHGQFDSKDWSHDTAIKGKNQKP